MTPFYAPITDPQTVLSLWQRHGPERATDIIAGRDIETAKDINAWRSLGAKAWRKHVTPSFQ